MALWFPQISISLIHWELSFIHRLSLRRVFSAVCASLVLSFRSRAALQLETLRHQLSVLQGSVKRPRLTTSDRLLWAWLCRIWPDWRKPKGSGCDGECMSKLRISPW